MAGTSLSGLQIGSSYAGLLKTTDNLVISGTLRVITDGQGTESALSLSTAGAKITGVFEVTGATTLAAVTCTTLTASGTVAGSNLSGTHAGTSSGTNTGDQTITLTGDVTGSGTGSFAATIAGNAVTLAKMAQIGANRFLGRLTAGTGNVEELTPLQARQAMQTLQSNLNSDLAGSIGKTQAGSLGADQVFSTAGAPTVTITPGTWLLNGSVAIRTSDTPDAVWAQFWNNTDSAAFGGGAPHHVNAAFDRGHVSVSGVITVTGNKVIYFKGFRAGASTLDIGAAGSVPSGFIQAVQLYI